MSYDIYSLGAPKQCEIALGKRREVLELCHQGVDCSHVSHMLLACFSHFTCVFAHMPPCGVPFGDENAHGMPFVVCMWHDLSQQKSQLADFWQKRKVCGTTSVSKGADSWIFSKKRCVVQPQQAKVLTCRFLAKKEMLWHDLSQLCHFARLMDVR